LKSDFFPVRETTRHELLENALYDRLVNPSCVQGFKARGKNDLEDIVGQIWKQYGPVERLCHRAQFLNMIL
jgi:hypothetical protein